MNELTKTCTYVGIALVAAVVAVWTRPNLDTDLTLDDMVGETLFENFTDTDKATSLEVVTFDDELSQIESFEVAKDAATGAWTIPSHAGYPADAENQMRDSASIFVGLEVLNVQDPQSETALADFGVVEPDKSKLKPGDKGVGTQTIIRDEKGNELVNLIIGDAVNGEDESETGTGENEQMRYVRIPGQSPVYTVKLDPSKLSTKFESWINKDLLDLASFDIEKVAIKDYTYRLTPPRLGSGQQGVIAQPRSNILVSWDSDASEWKLDELVSFTSEGDAVKSNLLDGEKPNKDKLNDLKNALDDLEIVDVRRKPEGVNVDLSSGQGLSAEGFNSLLNKGFYPLADGLKGANGEINVGTKDGVTYVLTFGNQLNDSEASRYLFVTAQVDQSKFPEPELTELPPKPAGTGDKPSEGESNTEQGKATENDASDQTNQNQDQDGTDEVPEAPTESTEENSDADGGEVPDDGCEPFLQQEGENGDQPETGQDTDDSQDEQPQDEQPQDEQPQDATGDDGPSTSPGDAPSAGTPADRSEGDQTEGEQSDGEKNAGADADDQQKPADDQDVKLAEWEAEVERVMKENKRKRDERDEKIKKAQEKVRQLNGKFAPWYYVISDDVYKKIHLNRGEVVVEDESAKKTGFDVDALRELEESGLKKDSDSDSDFDDGDTP